MSQFQSFLDEDMDDPLPSQGELQNAPNRRQLLGLLAGFGIGGAIFQRALAHEIIKHQTITKEMVQSAQWIAGVELTEEEQDEVTKGLNEALQETQKLQAYAIDADIPPAFAFVPHFFAEPSKIDEDERKRLSRLVKPKEVDQSLEGLRPEQIAFLSVAQLGKGLRTRKWTSRQLATIYLERLKKYDPLLHCVINYTEDLAWRQADQADDELSKGIDRGPLHGIPWGAKDLIAVPPYPTTWGTAPYREQIRPHEATVARRLHDSGAVLIAKLSLGTLAWGEIWHDAMTRNPWNPDQGSSGSSAGSACATVAGLVGFALGSETLGSIVSPTRRCRVTGLRPTFGRVSRYGCMTLSWTMDKIGPIVRHAEDTAPILAAILGSDGLDATVVDRHFHWDGSLDLAGTRIGVAPDPNKTEQAAIELLKEAGATTVPFSMDTAIPEGALLNALTSEAAAAHDDLIRAGTKDSELGKWGPNFRIAQWDRTVDYLRGMRARSILIQETEKALRRVDVVIGGDDLVRTNLTGHPSMVVAMGETEIRDTKVPGTIKLTSKMFDEAILIKVGTFLQRAMPPQPAMPPLDEFLAKIVKE